LKLLISDPKNGKTYQTEIPSEKEGLLVGVKIGDSLDGGIVGAGGYKLQVTGGSDKSGVPMRPDVAGGKKLRALLSDGPGFRPKDSGQRMRKSVRGNILTNEISQVNTKVAEYGASPLEELFGKKEEKKEEEKKEEKK